MQLLNVLVQLAERLTIAFIRITVAALEGAARALGRLIAEAW